MHCNCSGSSILGKLQRLSGLQKLSLVSKSGLSAYNDYVQNTSDTCGPFSEHDFPCYKTCGIQPGHPRAAVHTSCQGVTHTVPASWKQLTTFASQLNSDTHALRPARHHHSVAATQASPAFQTTKNLFKEDMAYALEHAHPASPRIAAQPFSPSQASAHSMEFHRSPRASSSHQQPSAALSVSRASSVNSAHSMADSVSSYHGYAGVNYNAGIKDIDAVPNHWGLSLNDYRSVLGPEYVHGCVPWEDQRVDKAHQKQFQKLHSERVQLLQELHQVERGIRVLMY